MENTAHNGADTAAQKIQTFNELLLQSTQITHQSDNPLPYGQKLAWLNKALDLAFESSEPEMLNKVTEYYTALTIRAALEGQHYALHSGHIYRRHHELAIAVATGNARLVTIRRYQLERSHSLPSALIQAQGHADYALHLVTEHEARNSPYTSAELLDDFLTELDIVLQILGGFAGANVSAMRSDRETLNLIGTATQNASFSIFRIFSCMSEWKKASIYCKWCLHLLDEISNQPDFILSQAQRATLQFAFRLAQSKLEKKNYKASQFHFDAAKAILRDLKVEF